MPSSPSTRQNGPGALEAGELARLLGVGLDRRIIRRGHLEIAGEAVMDRAAVAVGQAQRDAPAG